MADKEINNDSLEESIIDVLAEIMGVIDKVRRKRIKGILNYPPYADKETRFLDLLRNPAMTDEIRDKYVQTYDSLRREAEQLDRLNPRTDPGLTPGEPTIYKFRKASKVRRGVYSMKTVKIPLDHRPLGRDY